MRAFKKVFMMYLIIIRSQCRKAGNGKATIENHKGPPTSWQTIVLSGQVSSQVHASSLGRDLRLQGFVAGPSSEQEQLAGNADASVI